MSYTSEYKKFYKVLKKKVASSFSKKKKSSTSKGSFIQNKSPKKLSQASTSDDPLLHEVFSGPVTQINVILEDSFSDSEDEEVQLIKCEYCLKKFPSLNKLYEHKLCHLNVPVEKLILPTPENIQKERTVLNKTRQYEQHVPDLQHVPTLQPIDNFGNNIVAQLPNKQPVLQSIPQIPNVQLFVQPSRFTVFPQLQQFVPQLQQVMRHNVPQFQQVVQNNAPRLQLVPQNSDPPLQTVKQNVPLLQLPLQPLPNVQQLQNIQPLQTVLPRKKKLVEVNGLTFEEWDDNNTSAETNMLNEELMLPTDIKQEITTEAQAPCEVDNTSLQQPATVATNDNEPFDPLAIDVPSVPVANNKPDPLSLKQITLPVLENSNQANPLAISQPKLNFPLRLEQLIAIPMQNGQILIAAKAPSSVNDHNLVPQKVLVPLGNMLSGSQLPIGNIVNGAQLQNVVTQQQNTQLPIVANQNAMLSLTNLLQQQPITTLTTQQQSTQLPIVANQNSMLSLTNLLQQQPITTLATQQQCTQLPIVANQNSMLSLTNLLQQQQPITTLATQQQSTQLPIFNVATKEQNIILPVNTQQCVPLPINNVANISSEIKYKQDIKSKGEIEKSDDLDELNYRVEQEQNEKNKKQQELIKNKLLKEPNKKREKKGLSEILRETAFAFQEDMIGAKQRRRRRPGVEPRKLKKSELAKKMLAEKTDTANTSTEKTVTAKDGPTNTVTEKNVTRKDDPTKTCTEKTVPVEKIIAKVDLTEIDEPEQNIPDYTPPPKFVRPGPSFIPGSAKIPGSWDKKPKAPITLIGSWNKTNLNPLLTINITQETKERNSVTVSEMPLKTSFLETLLNQKSRPLNNFYPDKNTVTANAVESKTVTSKDVAEKNVTDNIVPNKTIMAETVTLPRDRMVQQVNVKKTSTTETETTWKNITLKDMIENPVPLNTVRKKAVSPETASQKAVVGKNLNKYKTKYSEETDIPMRFDKLVESSMLHCMYCNQISENWYSLISHMRLHLKVTLSQIEKCIICTEKYCTKEGGKFCYDCAPFYKEAQDEFDLAFNEKRKNLKFVKLNKDLDEPECILEDLDSDCELQDPLAPVFTKEEPFEENCTNIESEINEDCTNIERFEDVTEKYIFEEETNSINSKVSTEALMRTNQDTIEEKEESVCTESESENDSCTHIDSFEDNDSGSCPNERGSNVDPDESEPCAKMDVFVEDNVCTNMDCDENYTCTNTDCCDCEENECCTNIDTENNETCTEVEKYELCTKKNPFQEKDAKLLQYCETCYYFGFKFTDCGIKNHIYKYKCVNEIKNSKKVLECNKCGGRFRSMKYVVRFITKKQMYRKVRKPAYNVNRMMQLQKKMAKLKNICNIQFEL